jgi:1-phosphofructokinase
MSDANRVVTVSINPAIDQTIAIPNFTPGLVNRVLYSRLHAGGKGVNVASLLSDFGQPATVTGFLGADNDEIYSRFFAKKGIDDRCIRIAGKTRVSLKIVDEAREQTTEISFPGQTPNLADIEHLFEVLQELAAARDWFVLTGSIPPGVSSGIYREMVKTLAGRKVVLDTSGEGFREALGAGPWLISTTVAELEELVGTRLDTPSTILHQARNLIQRYRIPGVVVSLGTEGAIYVEAEESVWALAPSAEVKSAVGTGDALVAGIVAGKLRGLSLAETARLAMAFSMNALTHIRSGLFSVEAVEAAMERVTLRDPADFGDLKPSLSSTAQLGRSDT